MSLVYIIGCILMTLGAIPPLHFSPKVFTIIGLLLIGVGSGGIKPCVSAFGGDQFKIPEQANQLASFFLFFYFSINAGSLLSTLITPVLRSDVHCFGDDSCFSLAFGVPAVLMIVSTILFVLGRFLYKVKKPSGNMILLVIQCISVRIFFPNSYPIKRILFQNAISTRWREMKTSPRRHWLDYAKPTYGDLTEDIKTLLNVVVLYLPLPIFWALFDQQGSRWTFQVF